MTVRYALYFAPAAGHPLWTAGCDWLGRDPEAEQRPPPPVIAPRRAATASMPP